MNSKNGVPESPKVGEQEKEKPLTLEKVKGFLKKDLHACILLLQACHDDQDVYDALATAVHGKYMNRLHQEELKRQTELGI